MRIEECWPHARWRAVAVDFDQGGSEAVTTFARVDIVAHPLTGCAAGKPMSACYDPGRKGSEPFTGERLRRGLLRPVRPTAILVGDTWTAGLVPGDLRRDVPVLNLFSAIERFWASVSSSWLRLCWSRGRDIAGDAPVRAENEALFLAEFALILMRSAPPDELASLAREGA